MTFAREMWDNYVVTRSRQEREEQRRAIEATRDRFMEMYTNNTTIPAITTTTGAAVNPHPITVRDNVWEAMPIIMNGEWGTPAWLDKAPSEKPKLEAVAVEVEEVAADIDAYAKMCEKIGWQAPAEAQSVLFKRFLAREEIAIYPMEQVAKYMDAVVEERNRGKSAYSILTHWYWHPLRGTGLDGPSMHSSGLAVSNLPYNKLVPIEALNLVEKILGVFPNAMFHVTDYAERRPDPFLSVSCGGEQFVIFKWLEPSFSIVEKVDDAK